MDWRPMHRFGPRPRRPLPAAVAAMLLLLSTGCEPRPDETPPSPWCAVETGLPGNAGEMNQVALRRQQAQGLAVLRQPLGVTKAEYHDGSALQPMGAEPPSAQASRLADGSWLMALSAGTPGFESTMSLLQLDVSTGTVRVPSAHLGWSTDVPPLHAWAALDGGWVHVDDTDLHDKHRVREDFQLEGEVVG